MDDRTGTTRLLAHADRSTVDLAESIFNALPAPSRALDLSSADLRASSIPAKRLQDARSVKRKGTADPEGSFPPRISFAPLNGHGHWVAQKTSKRSRLQLRKETQADLHQSTCLKLNSTGNDETDLWILPDFDEWELDTSVTQAEETPQKNGGEWAPLVERAVSSNRERLRRRLEGDGWDFVCGRYGEDGKTLKELTDAGEESLDEEFDVVVLPTVQISC